jgi:hypothetical protein
MSTPDEMERQHTLLTAAARYDALRTRDALAPPTDPQAPPDVALTRDEALELLALGEVLARKAGYGRQLAVRTARTAGASWSQIGAALGTSKQSAWEAHARWIDDQAGWDDDDMAAARGLAGQVDDPREA